MPEFFTTPAGRALFGVLIALLAVVIVDLNYKWFFKAFFDFVFAFLATVICTPVLAVCSVISAKNAGKVFEKRPYLGKNGKIIYLYSFAGIENRLKNLPRLFDIMGGRMSFVGVKLMEVGDGALIDDNAMSRFSARPGLICHLALSVYENLTYGQMFTLDARYAKRRELFTDIFIVIKSAALAVRGEGKSYFGETYNNTYAETLISQGVITKETAERALTAAEEAMEEDRKRKELKKKRYN
ncbi:MAG: sugar transferase [Ruminococcus flavefaciens]|nr:sugar transferase [Ruminococcus flavefaciens]